VKIPASEYPEAYWRAQAETNGIGRRRYASRRREGMSPQEAATRPLRPSYAPPPDPSSLAERCRAAGISDTTVHKWRARHPDCQLTDDEIIQASVARKAAAEERNRQKERCAEKRVSYDTIRARMAREGLTFEEALERPLISRQAHGRAQRHHLKDLP